jgi:hypothetical protein
MSGQLYRLTSSWFVAGLITDSDGYVVRAAPVLKHYRGWHINDVRKREWRSQIQRMPAGLTLRQPIG